MRLAAFLTAQLLVFGSSLFLLLLFRRYQLLLVTFIESCTVRYNVDRILINRFPATQQRSVLDHVLLSAYNICESLLHVHFEDLIGFLLFAGCLILKFDLARHYQFITGRFLLISFIVF